MIFPRTRRQSARYGRHKALAAIVTFLVLWTAAKLLGWDDRIRQRFTPVPPPVTAEVAFRDRISETEIEATGVVESFGTLHGVADSSAEGDGAQDLLLRLPSGHPLVVRADSASLPRSLGIGDTVRVRGLYSWDNRGGSVAVGSGDPIAVSLQQLE